MNNYVLGFVVYLAIGVLRVRRKDGPGGAIAMVAHNFPYTGLAMLFTCLVFWPIEKIAMMIFISFIKDKD